jgi:hypothetical protein
MGATPESEGARMEPFIPQETRDVLQNKDIPIIITQGHEETAIKLRADKCSL